MHIAENWINIINLIDVILDQYRYWRSEIEALHGQYSGQLSDWRARCEAAEAKYAAAHIQVIVDITLIALIDRSYQFDC